MAAWLATHTEHLVAAAMVYRKNQAVYGSVVMAIPKCNNNFRLVSIIVRSVQQLIRPGS